MLPQNKPDRIRILFDDHRLVANAGLLLPATPRPAPGPARTRRPSPWPRRRAGTGEDWGQDADAGRFRAGRRRLHRRRRCAARWWDGRCSRLRGQGAIHPGDLPAQLPVGACPSTRPREPPLLARAWAAGAGPGDSPLTIDLDSTICETYGLAKEGARHHGYTGARGYHPLLAIAAGTGEGADVPAARWPGHHRPWRRPLPASVGVPPMLTIGAMADRIARSLARSWTP